MNFSHNVNFKNYCESGNLKSLKILKARFPISKEYVLHNDLIKIVCEKGFLDVCIWLLETFQLKKHDFTRDNNEAFRISCKYGQLNICKWLHSSFCLTIEDVTIYENQALRWACYNNHLNICEWLFETFPLILNNSVSINEKRNILLTAYNTENYETISFLIKIGCITQNFILKTFKILPKEKIEKFMDLIVPLGSFTKPAVCYM
jgi:hypothetical protein